MAITRLLSNLGDKQNPMPYFYCENFVKLELQDRRKKIVNTPNPLSIECKTSGPFI